MRTTLVALALLVTGCAGANLQGNVLVLDQQPAQSRIQQALSDLADFAIADLQWASADAHAKSDLIFYTCWDGLIPIVQELKALKDSGGGTLPQIPLGAASGVQQIRDVIRGQVGAGAGAGPSVVDRIVVSCAGMSQAIIADQAKVAANVGSAISGVGAAPAALNALKGIGPILKLMPLPIPLG